MENSKMVNFKEIRVFGLKRSGNHAIINWLFSQISGKVVFLNNCYLAGQKLNLYTGKGRIDCKGINYWDFKRKRFFLDRNPFKSKEIVTYSKEDPRLSREKLKNSSKQALIISFEGRDIQYISNLLEEKHDKLLGESKEIFSVVILRDPFNMLASFYQKWNQKNLEEQVLNWISYAKKFIEFEEDSCVYNLGINYNEWVVSKDYRCQLMEKFQLPFTDLGKNEVTNFGQGSSFDNLAYHKSAENMQVFERWRKFQDDEKFKSFLRNQELITISQKIFNNTSEIVNFLN